MAEITSKPHLRCMWCGEIGVELHRLSHRKEYEGVLAPTHAPILVCGEHSKLLDSYLLERARRSGATLAGFLLVVLLVLVGGVAGVSEISASGLLICGVWALLYPYATPEVIRRFGASNSKFLMRWVGGLILTAGSVWLGLMILK